MAVVKADAMVVSIYPDTLKAKGAKLKGLGLLNTRITQLHNDSHADAMTGLFNRRRVAAHHVPGTVRGSPKTRVPQLDAR
ncbi:TPA: hypothetical protein ACW7Y0_002218 [Aeromonas hydrophila]